MPQRTAPHFVVRVNNRIDDSFRVLSIHQAMGGHMLDTAQLEFDLAGFGEHLEFSDPLERLNGRVEISLEGGDDGIRRALHFGYISQSSSRISGRGETLRVTSKTETFLFGHKTEGMLERDPVSGEFVLNPDTIVFNPMIDRVVEPNRHSDDSSGLFFLDPESVRTDAARRLHGVPAPWNLAEAIVYLCQHCNPESAPILNPSIFDLRGLTGRDPYLLQNVKIPTGLSLPEALDHLLEPFSYTWCIDYLGIGQRGIAVFRRGQGRGMVVKHQRPGEALDTDKSNAPGIDVDCQLGGTVNFLTVRGDYVYIEGTFELQKGWPTDKDGTTTDQLKRDSTDYLNDPTLQRVWRDWVLNEAGDYTGQRDELTAPYDFGKFFTDELSGRANQPEPNNPGDQPNDPDDPDGDLPEEIRQPMPAPVQVALPGQQIFVVPKRRHFHKCITLGDDDCPIGEVDGCHVDYTTDGGDTWKPVAQLGDHSCHLLARECGVRFDSHMVPIKLWSAGQSDPTQVKVRITATVRVDLKLLAAVSGKEVSPLATFSDELIDSARRFPYRVVGQTSVFYDQVNAGTRKAKQRRSDADLARYAARVLDGWNMADIDGTFEIEGLDGVDYRVGDVIEGVEGREINLEVTPTNAPSRRFPQIVGISYDRDKQRRTLTVKTFKNQHPR